MNGSMPSEKSVALCNEPPDMDVSMLRKLVSSKMLPMASALSPGTGM